MSPFSIAPGEVITLPFAVSGPVEISFRSDHPVNLFIVDDGELADLLDGDRGCVLYSSVGSLTELSIRRSISSQSWHLVLENPGAEPTAGEYSVVPSP